MPIEGTIRFRVTLGTWLAIVKMDIDFLIIDALNNAYDAILGRASLNKARAIVSTLHLLMKFLTPNKILQVRANQVTAKRCYMASLQDFP